MTALRHALADYLAMRRAMGSRLPRAEKLLAQFLTYLEERGQTRLRIANADACGHRNGRGGDQPHTDPPAHRERRCLADRTDRRGP